MRYRLQARNTATASSNKIHDDTVARRYGFRGGLVPGVDVYAYLCHLPAALWGRRWLESGTMEVRFRSPVYHGDLVDLSGELERSGVLGVSVRDSVGDTCATGVAGLPAVWPEPPEPEGWPSGEAPDDPPEATPESLTAAPLGRVRATFRADRAGEYLDDVEEDLPLFRRQGFAHPGWLLRFANSILVANVRLGPWIHVESRAQHFAPVVDGATVETRARVTEVTERKGHHFVELDVLQLADGQPCARISHVAIYRLREA